jgi:replicative DNA helicase
LQNSPNDPESDDFTNIPPSRLGSLEDFRDHCRSRIQSRFEFRRDGYALGPLVGISPEFGQEFGGYFDEGLTVLHGEPGSGKSALASQIAAQCGCPCLYVSFEMGREVLINRHLAREDDEYLGKFRSGEMGPKRWDALFEKAFVNNPNLAHLKIFDATKGKVTTDEICDAAISTKGDFAHLLVVLDSAHAMVRGLRLGGGKSAYDATEEAITIIQQLSAELECTILLVAEQNRSSRGTRKQDAAANASIYEYGTNHVIALLRDPDCKPDSEGEIPISAVFCKNRSGQQGVEVGLKFKCSTMRFRGDSDFCEDDE